MKSFYALYINYNSNFINKFWTVTHVLRLNLVIALINFKPKFPNFLCLSLSNRVLSRLQTQWGRSQTQYFLIRIKIFIITQKISACIDFFDVNKLKKIETCKNFLLVVKKFEF